jgi:hypothetical protein
MSFHTASDALQPFTILNMRFKGFNTDFKSRGPGHNCSRVEIGFGSKMITLSIAIDSDLATEQFFYDLQSIAEMIECFSADLKTLNVEKFALYITTSEPKNGISNKMKWPSAALDKIKDIVPMHLRIHDDGEIIDDFKSSILGDIPDEVFVEVALHSRSLKSLIGMPKTYQQIADIVDYLIAGHIYQTIVLETPKLSSLEGLAFTQVASDSDQYRYDASVLSIIGPGITSLAGIPDGIEISVLDICESSIVKIDDARSRAKFRILYASPYQIDLLINAHELYQNNDEIFSELVLTESSLASPLKKVQADTTVIGAAFRNISDPFEFQEVVINALS